MLEWLKRHAWKACKPLKGFAGSNPALSAINAENQQIVKQAPNFTLLGVKLGAFVLFKILYLKIGTQPMLLGKNRALLLIKFIQSHNN